MRLSSRDVVPIEFTVRCYQPTIIFIYAKKISQFVTHCHNSLNPLSSLQPGNAVVVNIFIIVRNKGDLSRCKQQ